MTELTEVRVPDIGDFSDVPVIEILVEVGDRIRPEDPLVTLESDKATMDVPAPAAGVVRELMVAVGDSVSEGSMLLRIEGEGAAGGAAGGGEAAPAGPVDAGAAQAAGDASGDGPAPRDATPAAVKAEAAPAGTGRTAAGASAPDPRAPQGRPSPTASLAPEPAPRAVSHATPAMRRYARELGVDLAKVKGTGRKGRVLREDISGFVKRALSAPPEAAAAGTGIPPIPAVDFGRFGEIETRPLSRIKRISGPHLHRSWVNVPHVTNHDEADVTDLEAFRRSIKDEAAAGGVRASPSSPSRRRRWRRRSASSRPSTRRSPRTATPSSSRSTSTSASRWTPRTA